MLTTWNGPLLRSGDEPEDMFVSACYAKNALKQQRDVFDERAAIPAILSLRNNNVAYDYMHHDYTEEDEFSDEGSLCLELHEDEDEDDEDLCKPTEAVKKPRRPLPLKQPRKRNSTSPVRAFGAQKRATTVDDDDEFRKYQLARKRNPSAFRDDDDSSESDDDFVEHIVQKRRVPRRNAKDSLPSLRELSVQLTDWSELSAHLIDGATKKYAHPFFANETLVLVRHRTRVFAFSHKTHGYYGQLGHPLTFRTWPSSVLKYDTVVRRAQRISDYAYKLSDTSKSPLPVCTAHQRSVKTECHCLWQSYNVYCDERGACTCSRLDSDDGDKSTFCCYNNESDFVPKIARNIGFYTFARNRRMKSEKSVMAINYRKICLPKCCVFELKNRNQSSPELRAKLLSAFNMSDLVQREKILSECRRNLESK